jgi:glycogen debranching enzyme
MIENKNKISDLYYELERLKSPKGYLYAGLPYFMGLFGRDSLISGWQLLDYDPTIAKDTFLALAAVQGQKVDKETGEEPGKICHEYYDETTPEDWFDQYKGNVDWLKKGKPVYFSIDSTPLFIIVFAKYLEKTNDLKTLELLWPHLQSALIWIIEYGLIDGFLRYGLPKEGLISQSWKDGLGKVAEEMTGPVAVVEVQGYTFWALKLGSEFARKMGNRRLAKKTLLEAEKLQTRFEEAFWNHSESYYCFALDGNNQKYPMITSNPGHLLSTGISHRNEDIVKRLFEQDLWTEYGIRTHSTLDKYFDPFAYQLGTIWPHDNWIIADGLKNIGYQAEYQRVTKAILAAEYKLGFLPEYFGVDKKGRLFVDKLRQQPCYPQAWSIGCSISFPSTEERTKVFSLAANT